MNQIGGASHHHHHHPSHHHHRYQDTPLTRHHRERFQEMAKCVDQSLSEPQDLSRRFVPPPPVRYPGYPPPPPPPPLIKTERESLSPPPPEVRVKTEPEDPGYGLAYSDNYQDRELARSFSLPARELDQSVQSVERQLSLDRGASRQHQGASKEEAGSSRTIIGRGGKLTPSIT